MSRKDSVLSVQNISLNNDEELLVPRYTDSPKSLRLSQNSNRRSYKNTIVLASQESQ